MGLLIIFAVLVFVILPIWAFVKISGLSSENEVFQTRLSALEHELKELRIKVRELADRPAARGLSTDAVAKAAEFAAPFPAEPPVVPPTTRPIAAEPSISAGPAGENIDAGHPLPPGASPAVPISTDSTNATLQPPPLPPLEPRTTAATTPRIRIDWEQFMGAKLFAWLGGLAGFLAVAFFVKYSIEHDWIPAEVRVAIGFVFSAGLVAGGLMLKPARFRITSQVLCATGIVSLYAVTFACNAVYHFRFFGPVPTFLLMTLVTAAAFLLAVRMAAQVIAILGLLGGFLTPILISTGHDNAGGLFGFVALLDAGLIAVALHRRWFHLVPLAVAGTVVMQIGWAAKFFEVSKAWIAITVCLGFEALFFLVTELARRLQRSSSWLTISAAVMAAISFGFAFFLQTYPSVAAAPASYFGFIFAADLLLLALVWRDETAAGWQPVAGGAAFALLGLWTVRHLTPALMPWGLASYLVFAVLHTAFPLVLHRRQPARTPGVWSQLYPPLALLLMLGPLLKTEDVSLLFWPAVLLIDALAVGLALVTASVAALGVVLLLTLGVMGLCIFQVPVFSTDFGSLHWVVAGFALFFFGAGLFVAQRIGIRLLQAENTGASQPTFFGGAAARIPIFSALLPFILLIMMSQRLSMPNPSSLFGLGLLCCVLVLGLTRLLTIAWLPLCALGGIVALEYAWHLRRFDVAHAGLPLGWYLGFCALFVVYPFCFRRPFERSTGPWATAALSGVVHFPLIYSLVRRTWPNDYLGLLPAAFAIPPLLSLVAIVRGSETDSPKRLNQVAWFGGAALLFITLIFPIQFDRQWITISWALEGMALLWLFHRVPHAGLRGTGVALLLVAFARLALNPAVLSYHARSDTPVFNWFLYAYGVTLACHFAGAWLLASPRDRVFGIRMPPLLNSLGLILAFLLLNLEIADYFSPAGGTLTFQFAGNFARDLAYTVGWALFALTLLALGIWKATRAARYAALALLSVTVLKLFFHDLARLGQLYRVGALVAVAFVAILASFLYQRFVPHDDRVPPAPP
jgi:uncharacterized membrane protein